MNMKDARGHGTDARKNSPASERVIVALDCSEEEAGRLAGILAGRARWLKVGMTLYYEAGPRVVASLKDQGFSVFVDLKLHDIPHQVRGATASIARAGADMLTVHGAGGPHMLQAAVEGAQQVCGPSRPAPLVVAVTVLTSMDAQMLAQAGVVASLDEQVVRLARLAQDAGLAGVVASAREARALRLSLGDDAVIVTPGVRPATALLPSDDQARTATPAAAFADGASHIVIGRPVTAADDVAAAFDALTATL